MKVGFNALIKELKVKSLVSGDKGATLMLQIDNPEDELINSLNRLQDPTKQVGVAIAESEND